MATMITAPGYDGVVLPLKQLADVGLMSAIGSAYDDVWLPTVEDVADFESGLVSYLIRAVPPERKALPSKVGRYKRQWFGVIAGGRRLVYGNFMCREAPGWKAHIIMVDDGGDCYFQLQYDVTSREYRTLKINGDG